MNPFTFARAFVLLVLSVCAVLGQGPEVAIRLDHPSGLYRGSFNLQIATEPAGSEVRFTLDGSLPSATHGQPAKTPLRVAGTTVLRAASRQADGSWSAPVTRTFVFPAQVLRQTGAGLPSQWGTNETQSFPAVYNLQLPPGTGTNGAAELERALRSLPTMAITLPPEDLFGAERGIYSHSRESGREWERAGSVEFIPLAGETGFAADCGVRIQGGWSRRPEESPKHGFRLEFRRKYGWSELRHPLFGPKPEGFTTLILRSGNNNTWLHPESAERRRAEFCRDPWMRATHLAMGYPAARDRFVHLYLNGLYWGVYNLAERPDADFCAQHLGGKEKDYDSMNAGRIINGDDKVWKEMFELANRGLEQETSYQRIGELLDLPAFADFILLNLYGANGDWDGGSNWYAARRRHPSGKWFFLEWDAERSLEFVEDNRLAVDDDGSPMRLFQKLRANAAFRKLFSDRAKLHLSASGLLSPVAATERYRRISSALDPAIAAEAARWGWYRHSVHSFRTPDYEVYDLEHYWRPEVARLLTEYFPNRNAALRKQLQSAGLLTVE